MKIIYSLDLSMLLKYFRDICVPLKAQCFVFFTSDLSLTISLITALEINQMRCVKNTLFHLSRHVLHLT